MQWSQYPERPERHISNAASRVFTVQHLRFYEFIIIINIVAKRHKVVTPEALAGVCSK